ncbi:VOC family protein [Foetidibacter luteolus]|uniref:VOC family protein n=1 Tax=Foetidibacter luteolus TaxID=2608880 RepID=UPI00129A9F11|nr:VOC family protein [Foetidibacter luteolus]
MAIDKVSRIATTIYPFLTVKGAAAAVEFYTAGLGAQVLASYELPGDRLVAKLAVEGAEFWVGDEEPEFGNYSPATLGGSPVRIILTVADPDAFYTRAVAAGATQVCPVTTEESWRIGKLTDPFGHTWEIGRPLDDE